MNAHKGPTNFTNTWLGYIITWCINVAYRVYGQQSESTTLQSSCVRVQWSVCVYTAYKYREVYEAADVPDAWSRWCFSVTPRRYWESGVLCFYYINTKYYYVSLCSVRCVASTPVLSAAHLIFSVLAKVARNVWIHIGMRQTILNSSFKPKET